MLWTVICGSGESLIIWMKNRGNWYYNELFATACQCHVKMPGVVEFLSIQDNDVIKFGPFVKSVVPILFCITFLPFLRKTFLSGSSLGADDVFAAIRERLATLNFTSCAGTARISASSAKSKETCRQCMDIGDHPGNKYARISGVKASSSARCFLAFMVLR